MLKLKDIYSANKNIYFIQYYKVTDQCMKNSKLLKEGMVPNITILCLMFFLVITCHS